MNHDPFILYKYFHNKSWARLDSQLFELFIRIVPVFQDIWGDLRNPNKNDQTYLTKIKFDFHYALIWKNWSDFKLIWIELQFSYLTIAKTETFNQIKKTPTEWNPPRFDLILLKCHVIWENELSFGSNLSFLSIQVRGSTDHPVGHELIRDF